jgi:predicted nucleic acid-binding Zn ribbon protein
MRKKETQNISELLKQFTQEAAYERKLLENRLIGNWGKMLGPGVAKATRNLYIANRTLFVAVDSSVMRHELLMIRSQIVTALNKSVGGDIIDQIIFK